MNPTDSNLPPEASTTWLDAWNHSPGPRTLRESVFLFVKGLAMGTADIIPGVSGGTIAFVAGIYQQLLTAIASVNLSTIRFVSRGEFKAALASIHLRFLVVLLAGIVVAVVSTARIMHGLLTHYPVETWSLFFGLILASIWYVGQAIPQWNSRSLAFIILGASLAWLIVGLIPVRTPDALWFLFLCGVIAISAMILPGLSGSFLLLILGKYQFITGAIRSPFEEGHLLALGVFVAGCAVGVLGFSRFLRYCLNHFEAATLCLLTGLMIGAMKKVWPWKVIIESELIGGKEYVTREENLLPALSMDLAIPLVLMALGITLVILLERAARRT